MAKVITYVCDRCSVEENPPKGEMPGNWRCVYSKMLCQECLNDLDAFLRGAGIEYVAVEPEEPHA